jgi:hypothetical protein
MLLCLQKKLTVVLHMQLPAYVRTALLVLTLKMPVVVSMHGSCMHGGMNCTSSILQVGGTHSPFFVCCECVGEFQSILTALSVKIPGNTIMACEPISITFTSMTY